MKRALFAVGLLAVIATTSFSETLVADIPFTFQVGKTMMPAGKYKVDQSGIITTVRSENGSAAVMAVSFPAERHSASKNPSLEFQRYGHGYFLSNIWTGDSQSGRALIKSRWERELARRATPSKPEEVALIPVHKATLQSKVLPPQGIL